MPANENLLGLLDRSRNITVTTTTTTTSIITAIIITAASERGASSC
jgi:hypothetical protein